EDTGDEVGGDAGEARDLGRLDHGVAGGAVLQAVEGKRFELGPGFGAEQLNLDLGRLVAGPEALNLDRGAVGEAYEPGAVIVGGELGDELRFRGAIVPVTEAAGAEARAGDARDAHRLGRAEDPPRGVQHVNAHIAEGAAAFLDEVRAPVRDAAAPY